MALVGRSQFFWALAVQQSFPWFERECGEQRLVFRTVYVHVLIFQDLQGKVVMIVATDNHVLYRFVFTVSPQSIFSTAHDLLQSPSTYNGICKNYVITHIAGCNEDHIAAGCSDGTIVMLTLSGLGQCM